MLSFEFSKYQGAGNDFVIIDLIKYGYDVAIFDTDTVATLCDRRFGIGADGLMLICDSLKADFKMIYFNADGGESTLCGNGSRCIVQYAYAQGIVGVESCFESVVGIHEAKINADNTVTISMQPIHEYSKSDFGLEIDSGSPHLIVQSTDTAAIDVNAQGRELRNQPPFKVKGINVNFLDIDSCKIRTYERGVEAETLACGTGVTAAAVSIAIIKNTYGKQTYSLLAKGGKLSVSYNRTGDQSFENITLTGPAEHVFDGVINGK